MSWIYGSARAKGAIHGPGDTCQDFALAETLEDGTLVAMVADGAGSTSYGGHGAETACRSMLESLRKSKDQGARIDRAALLSAFKGAIEAVESLALERGVPASEFASTLVAAIVSRGEAFFIQIGDGAGVLRMGGEYTVAIWPVETEFVNSTQFVTTPNALQLVQVRRVAGMIEEVVVFSDGLQYLVLDFKEKKPHQRFFASVSEQLTGSDSGRSANFDAWLQALLEAPQVTSRSDDDTSIVYARSIEVGL